MYGIVGIQAHVSPMWLRRGSDEQYSALPFGRSQRHPP